MAYRLEYRPAHRRSASGKAKEAKKQSSCGCQEGLADIKKMLYVQLIMLLSLFAFFLGVLLKYFGKI